ncbi:MAG: hypothetical protein ABIC95_04535 [archaeon]
MSTDEESPLRIKAFGKILLCGGYAILEPGNMGVVMNVDSGVTAQARRIPEPALRIISPQFKMDISFPVSQLEKEGPELALPDGIPSGAAFILHAIGMCAEFLRDKDIAIPQMEITLTNDETMTRPDGTKTGFGSSAASTVALTAMMLRMAHVDDRDAVYAVACAAHRNAQGGIGSNYDIAASCYGAHVFIAPDLPASGTMMTYKDITASTPAIFSWPESLLTLTAFTGESASTIAMVNKVREWKSSSPAEYSAFMGSYEKINRDVYRTIGSGPSGEICAALSTSWEKRKELGILSGAPIETEKHTMLLNGLREHGAAAAHFVGAGGGDAILAICKDEAERVKLADWIDSQGLLVLDTRIGNMPYVTLGQNRLK